MTDDNGGALRWRIDAIERQLDKGPDLQVMRQRLDDHETDMNEIRGELRSIRRGLWVAAATFASLTLGVAGLIVNLH